MTSSAKTITHPASRTAPLLFSYSHGGADSQHLMFKIDGTEWSEGFNIDVVGHPSVLELSRGAALCPWKVCD